jgi:hypothetical protein
VLVPGGSTSWIDSTQAIWTSIQGFVKGSS